MERLVNNCLDKQLFLVLQADINDSNSIGTGSSINRTSLLMDFILDKSNKKLILGLNIDQDI